MLGIFFSDFTIKATGVGKQQSYEIDYKLKEPREGFLQSNNFVRGRPRANNFEPYIIDLLHTLNQSWNPETHRKETAPIVKTIVEYDGSNQIKGRVYAY